MTRDSNHGVRRLDSGGVHRIPETGDAKSSLPRRVHRKGKERFLAARPARSGTGRSKNDGWGSESTYKLGSGFILKLFDFAPGDEGADDEGNAENHIPKRVLVAERSGLGIISKDPPHAAGVTSPACESC